MEEKEEYYYISKKAFTEKEIENILGEYSYKIGPKRNFKEKYLKTISMDKEDYFKEGKIYKFYENSEEKGFVETLQEIKYIEEDKKFLIKFLNKKIGYEDKKISEDKMNDYLNYLKAFNLEVFLELEWDTIEYIKDSVSISLGSVKLNGNDKKKIIFMSKQKIEDKEIIEKLGLVELEELVIKYISK